MHSDINGLNLNSMEMLEYIEFDENDMDRQRIASSNNRQSFADVYMMNKLKTKASLAILRLLMLYLFYYIDSNDLSQFISNMVGFLLIHEALVISNYCIVNIYLVITRILFGDRPHFPSFCAYVDLFNNFIFFTWFVYGNLCILSDREGIEVSLTNNRMMTYYITVLILLGYFIYSKLIFYIIFFVSFCPCITYVLCFDLHQDYQNNRRINRIHQILKEEIYEEFTKRVGFELETCIICTGEFTEKHKVICLPCNTKHTFHTECIRQWIDKKPICPLCRVELNTQEDHYDNYNYNPPRIPLRNNNNNNNNN